MPNWASLPVLDLRLLDEDSDAGRATVAEITRAAFTGPVRPQATPPHPRDPGPRVTAAAC